VTASVAKISEGDTTTQLIVPNLIIKY